MTTLVDAKWAALSVYPGAMPEKTLAWLQANGATSSAIPDAWQEMLQGKGFGVAGESNIITLSGSNYVVGTSQPASNVNPQVEGLDVFYFGSFGESFWNLRLGAGTSQIPGITQVTVTLGDAGPRLLSWNGGSMRYEGAAGENLWTLLGADVGQAVSWTVETTNGTTTGLSQVGVAYQRSTAWFDLLRSLGYTGQLNDMELAFWEAGGLIP